MPNGVAIAMRVHAVINERAGSALGQDQAVIEASIRAPFERHGHDVTIEFSKPENLIPAITAAAQSDADTVVVGGGDGTVRSAAGIVIEAGKTLGILPLGTLNRMARDLGIPLDIASAAEALARAQPGKIDIASVNGKFYLCNSLIGLPPQYSAERQRLRGRPLTERLSGYTRVIKTLLSSQRRLRITMDDGTEQRPLRVMSLAVSNNAYCEQPGLGLVRPKLDGGELAIYASRHRSGWAMARAFARAILGRWKGDPYLQQFRAHDITLRTGHHSVKLSNDGEVETMTSPLRYKIHPKALNILLPQAA